MSVESPFGDYSITNQTRADTKTRLLKPFKRAVISIHGIEICLWRNIISLRWMERETEMQMWGEMFSWQAGIRCGSINMLGSLVCSAQSGKNRPSSQGKWWRLQPACITSHKSASSSYWKKRRDKVWGEHQWSPRQHMQSDAGKALERNSGSDWLASSVLCVFVCVEEMCGC